MELKGMIEHFEKPSLTYFVRVNFLRSMRHYFLSFIVVDGVRSLLISLCCESFVDIM